MTLQPGDLLLLYTDGITEAMAPAKGGSPRDQFGVDRLDALLLECDKTTTTQCLDRVMTAVTAFGGTSLPADDQTLIAIRCLPDQ